MKVVTTVAERFLYIIQHVKRNWKIYERNQRQRNPCTPQRLNFSYTMEKYCSFRNVVTMGVSKEEDNIWWLVRKKICHFLCILESGELYSKGDNGCLVAESMSKSNFFSIGLVLVLELDLRLFDYHKTKTERLYKKCHGSQHCQMINKLRHKRIFTLTDALLLRFPSEPSWFLSLWCCLNSLLFSKSSILFSSKSSFTCIYQFQVMT